jgi:hypothetical protein
MMVFMTALSPWRPQSAQQTNTGGGQILPRHGAPGDFGKAARRLGKPLIPQGNSV